MTKEALTLLVHEMEYVLSCINAEEIPFDGDDFHEALRLGKEALAQQCVCGEPNSAGTHRTDGPCLALQQEQEPVAMKFKIYKPTVPDPVRQGINNALLPWVYDQDRSSGFDASMWVTPVATLPPQRKPLTDEQIGDIAALFYPRWQGHEGFARAIEAAHGIKE